MRSTRTLVIGSSESSRWRSSRTIEANLKSAYALALPNGAATLSFDSACVPPPPHSDRLLAKGEALVEKILKRRPKTLIFIGDSPHPGPLLAALKAAARAGPLPEIYIHAYGNFTLLIPTWLRFAHALRAYRVTWICASPKQSALLHHFIAEPRGRVFVVPFPVDRRAFHHSETARRAWRKRLGVAPGERMLLYSGRLSLQKNTTTLIEETAKLIAWNARALDRSRTPVRLFLAGAFDDLTDHVIGLKPPEGYYFSWWHEVYDELPRAAQRRIACLGDLEATDLNGAYNASDLFVSLSLHHDEDFGMAPAEALCAGAAAVLTDWGGYSGFNLGRRECGFVPVRTHKGYPALDSTHIQRELRRVAASARTPAERRATSTFFQSRFSCDPVHRLLRALQGRRPEPFRDFTTAAYDFESAILTPGDAMSASRRRWYDRLYKTYRAPSKEL